MGDIALLVIGLLIVVLGVVNMRGNVSTIHWYNRMRVKEEDLPQYGKVLGLGTIVIGVGMIFAYLMTLWNEHYVSHFLIISSVIGFLIMLYGQLKYNNGIF